MSVVVALLYPNEPLPSAAELSDPNATENEAVHSTTGSANYWSAMRNAFTPGMLGFLVTFTIAGSALIYGIGEFPAAVKAKDECKWDEDSQDFRNCKGQSVQDTLNYVAMPLGNFTLPVSMLLGMIIDKWGFAIPAFINIASVQAFVASLWLMNLEGQYITLILYNIAFSCVFTIQNAYICSVNQALIGGLFAISNIVLSIGNIAAMWLNTNPFGTGADAVRSSLMISCAFWLIVMFPLYLWPGMETSTFKAFFAAKSKEDGLPHDTDRITTSSKAP